jgi:predicted metal-dependent peptidase
MLATRGQQRLAGAAQQALQAGKLSDTMARIVDHLLRPRLPWRMLLDRYMMATAHDDYTYLRPSNRRTGDAVFPSLRSTQTDVVVALDTSGSIQDSEMTEFITEINAIKGHVRARITLLACDADLSEDGPWTYEPWETFDLPRRFSGGGGTNFTPVFDWIAEASRPPDLLVYFTDAKGEFPADEPTFPTLWLVKGREPVPWGRRIQLN